MAKKKIRKIKKVPSEEYETSSEIIRVPLVVYNFIISKAKFGETIGQVLKRELAL